MPAILCCLRATTHLTERVLSDRLHLATGALKHESTISKGCRSLLPWKCCFAVLCPKRPVLSRFFTLN